MRRLAATAAAALVVTLAVPGPVAADAGDPALSADVGELAIAVALLVAAGVVGRIVGPERRHAASPRELHRPR